MRILDGDAATAAKTRVLIESRDAAGRAWTTVGSATNIIAASELALVDSLEYAIWKSGAELRRRDERHFTAQVPTHQRQLPLRTNRSRLNATGRAS